jgi:hypothetical protein
VSKPTTPEPCEKSLAGDILALRGANTRPVVDPCEDVADSSTRNRSAVLHVCFGRERSGALAFLESTPERSAADGAADAAEDAAAAWSSEVDHAGSLRALQEKSDLSEQTAADWKPQLAVIVEIHRQLKSLEARGCRQVRAAAQKRSQVPVERLTWFAPGVE